MTIINSSLLTAMGITTTSDLYRNSTLETNSISSFSTIFIIIILSCLSISGWIFMSYALLGRSEAYRAKPDDPFGSSNPRVEK